MTAFHHSSPHVSEHLACHLEARVTQLDTHVRWDADLCWRDDRRPKRYRRPLFRGYLCDAEMLLDWIKRHVVVQVDKAAEAAVQPGAWNEVELVLGRSRPLMTFPLTEEAVEFEKRYREPRSDYSYEAVVEHFSARQVHFRLTLWGWKYETPRLKLSRDAFYILTDRLGARVRFLAPWDAFEEGTRKLAPLLDSPPLRTIKKPLSLELKRLSSPSDDTIDSVCRAMLPLLERLLVDSAHARGWKTRGATLDVLISQFESAGALGEDAVQIARLVTKPYRDFVTHGRRLVPAVARVVLCTTIECFIRLASDLRTD